MSEYQQRPREGAAGGAVHAVPVHAGRIEWRRYSVIVCSRQHYPLQLLDPHTVCSCSCEDHRRSVKPYQDAVLRRDTPKRPPLLRADSFSLDDESQRHPRRSSIACESPGHVWTAPLPPRVPANRPARPALKGHMSHIGGPLGPHTAVPTRGESDDSAWIPTSRRLLLEPAPRRLSVRTLPYGGPALRSPGSAFHRVERTMGTVGAVGTLPPPYFVGDVVYSMPLYSSLVVPQDLCVSAVSSVTAPPPARPCSAPTAARPHQVLRVLRPEELELKGPKEPHMGALDMPTLDAHVEAQVDDGAWRKGGKEDDAGKAVVSAVASSSTRPPAPHVSVGRQGAGQEKSKRQWLMRVVRENFNEQIGLLVERFVRRPRHDKSVRRVPGIGRKVNINLQDFWRRNSGQERHMKTKDLLTVYSDSGMDWKAFQKWLTKDLQFMPSCAKLCALSLDIYQKYWNTDWDEAGTSGPTG